MNHYTLHSEREATWVYCTCYNLNSDRYFQYNSTENPLVHCVVSFLVWSTLMVGENCPSIWNMILHFHQMVHSIAGLAPRRYWSPPLLEPVNNQPRILSDVSPDSNGVTLKELSPHFFPPAHGDQLQNGKCTGRQKTPAEI